MRAMGSLIMTQADKAKVPAGSALAVDRDVFSQGVTRALAEHPNVDIVRARIDALPQTGMTIVATGPLTAMSLAENIGDRKSTRLNSSHYCAHRMPSSA